MRIDSFFHKIVVKDVFNMNLEEEFIQLEWLNYFIIINLIGISTNLDNTGVGIAYGMKYFRIPFWFNGIINLIGFFYTIVGALFGSVILQFISAKETGLISCCILCCLGIFTIYNGSFGFIFGEHKSEVKIQQPRIQHAIILGFSLSLTNIVGGLGAAVAYKSIIWLMIISITIWGYITIWIGNIIGNTIFAKVLGKYSFLVAGLMFIIIGLKQLF